MKLVLLAVAFGLLLVGANSVYGLSTKVTAKISVDNPPTHKIVVYVLYGEHNQGYKQKKVSLGDSDSKKVTIKLSVNKGSPAKVCAYDARDDEKFKCSKHITLDQKRENVKISLRNT